MLSKGVTAKRDSVNPAPNPATTVLGPEILPFSSWRTDFMASKATNPTVYQRQSTQSRGVHARIPALSEFPIISVVHPAYHWRPNGGHGSFWPWVSWRLS